MQIDHAALADYARTLPAQSPPAPDLDASATDEARAAFSLQLNAINFGSGWFPTLNKPPGLSGFRTVEAGLKRRGPWTAQQLQTLTRDEIARTLGQDPDHPLMALFETHLRELGTNVDGPFTAFLARFDTPEALATELSTWPGFSDSSPYPSGPVPFFKRAQIAAADLALARLIPDAGLERLTLFADNLVPHVLRIDGVLRFDPELKARIDNEELIEHDAPEEVEIRATALHAAELLVRQHGSTTATAVDNVLWQRGGAPRYKAHPRHRARTTAY